MDFQSIAHRLFASVPKTLTVLFADSRRALTALDTLSSDPGSASNIQRYQDGFTESNLSALTASISHKLPSAAGPTIGSTDDTTSSLRIQNALQVIEAVLYSCQVALKDAGREVDSVHLNLNVLRDQIAELKSRVGSDVLGKDEASEIKSAVERAKEEVKVTLDRLTWWSLPWRVDDVATAVTAAISNAWCRELEDKVNYSALSTP